MILQFTAEDVARVVREKGLDVFNILANDEEVKERERHEDSIRVAIDEAKASMNSKKVVAKKKPAKVVEKQ